MVVDDEAVVRQTLVMTLGALGHEVMACEDGAAAIEAYRRHWRELDAVVLDMMMPGLTGRETFLALKEINPDVRVLLASGYTVDREAEATLKAGAADFIQKPFRTRDLSSRLVELVRSRSQER
jgi:CheY-like chemotaxis protein